MYVPHDASPRPELSLLPAAGWWMRRMPGKTHTMLRIFRPPVYSTNSYSYGHCGTLKRNDSLVSIRNLHTTFELYMPSGTSCTVDYIWEKMLHLSRAGQLSAVKEKTHRGAPRQGSTQKVPGHHWPCKVSNSSSLEFCHSVMFYSWHNCAIILQIHSSAMILQHA